MIWVILSAKYKYICIFQLNLYSVKKVTLSWTISEVMYQCYRIKVNLNLYLENWVSITISEQTNASVNKTPNIESYWAKEQICVFIDVKP